MRSTRNVWIKIRREKKFICSFTHNYLLTFQFKDGLNFASSRHSIIYFWHDLSVKFTLTPPMVSRYKEMHVKFPPTLSHWTLASGKYFKSTKRLLVLSYAICVHGNFFSVCWQAYRQAREKVKRKMLQTWV